MRSFHFHTKPRIKRPEAALQKAVIQHLMLTGVRGMIYFSVPNEGKRSDELGAELRRMGMRSGVADLCLVIAGRAHFLEIKSRDGKQSQEQKLFQADCEEAGIPYAIVYGIDQALKTLRGWGAVKTSRTAMEERERAAA